MRQIQQTVGTTTILVTHDQGEAMALSDRIVVMNRGRAEHVARPTEIYRAPATAFVANFLGKINVLPYPVRLEMFDEGWIEERYRRARPGVPRSQSSQN